MRRLVWALRCRRRVVVPCAGAQVVRLMVKQARRDAGVTRDVLLVADPAVPWYSIAAGSVHVHCLGRALREELDLEEHWGSDSAANVRWWPQVRRLTVDTIRADGEDEGGRGEEQQAVVRQDVWGAGRFDREQKPLR
jgi:hypothetical protein